VVFIDAAAHLDGYRYIGAFCFFDCAGNDGREQVNFPRQSRASAVARHFGHRAAEVEINVISAVFFYEHPDSFAGVDRINRVQLNRARHFVDVVFNNAHGFWVTLDESPGCHHLRNIEAAAVFSTEPPERFVGDAGHWRKHNWYIDGEVADRQGRHLHRGLRRCWVRHTLIANTSLSRGKCRARGRSLRSSASHNTSSIPDSS
jgi:hypothetical protein